MTEIEKSVRAFIREMANEIADTVESKHGWMPTSMRLSDEEIDAIVNKLLDEKP